MVSETWVRLLCSLAPVTAGIIVTYIVGKFVRCALCVVPPPDVEREYQEAYSHHAPPLLGTLERLFFFSALWVPQRRQAFVRAALRRAYRAASAAAARRQLQTLASWLETNSHRDAAASLREGLEETLTVLKLELPSTLRRFFATTNCIENLIATLRHVTRNVKRWRPGDMIHRWAGLGLVRAAARFRRIKHHRDLPHLVRALGRNANAEVAA